MITSEQKERDGRGGDIEDSFEVIIIKDFLSWEYLPHVYVICDDFAPTCLFLSPSSADLILYFSFRFFRVLRTNPS